MTVTIEATDLDEVLRSVQTQFGQALCQHPEVETVLDSIDLCTADRESCIEAMQAMSPALELVRGYAYGIYFIRSQIAAITGRPYGTRALAREQEEVVRRIEREFYLSEEAFPDFHIWLDNIEPCTGDRTEVLELLAAAPSDAVRGYLLGICVMRIQLAAVTGRAFA